MSLHAVTDAASVPLAWRLYLPKDWADPQEPRRAKTGVPDQVDHREKWRLALDMVDETRSWGLADQVVVADAGYGQIHGLRHGLAERGLDYVVAVRGDLNSHPGGAVPQAPERSGPGPRLPRYRTPARSLKDLALEQGRTALRRCTWRQGSRGAMRGRLLVMDVRLAGKSARQAALDRAGGRSTWDGVLPIETLIAARVVQGLATGIATGALGAGLLDTAPGRGPLINSVAPIAGMAAGALGSGALVQYLPEPMRLVYVVLIVLLLSQAVGIRALNETAARRPGALASLRPNIGVPQQARRAMLVAAPIDIAVWALGGFYLSLGPSLTSAVTGSTAPLAAGAAVFALTISGAAAVLVLRSAPATRVMLIGATALATGIAITLAGVHLGVTTAFFAGTAVAGIGFGAGFQGAVRTVVPLAATHERAGLMSSFYLLSYLAMCLPAITAGIAVDALSLVTVTGYYGAALIALAVLAAVGTFVVHRTALRS
ncbi:transposase [Streptomonospora nanhaiensis]|uniref:Transposase n=1 Tax=Streptomonospora nanhaiensis TaxID=1323731 RepID=A0ABY6YTJ9_9ACTN|nr:transposase [Streptomonospora nanhaiensis]WAE75728.1 transposase [Streptomonospora nanhaiensis]